MSTPRELTPEVRARLQPGTVWAWDRFERYEKDLILAPVVEGGENQPHLDTSARAMEVLSELREAVLQVVAQVAIKDPDTKRRLGIALALSRELSERAVCPRCHGTGGVVETDIDGTEMRPCEACGGRAS